MRNTILVLDRDPTNQLLLFRILGGAGYAVASARDGAEALAKIEARPPGLIVANVNLPGKSGAEIAQLVKMRPSPIPVILMSPEADPTPIPPADFVVGSPIDASKILEAVRRLLSGDEADSMLPADRILVIDDDLAILNLLENLLAGEGYQVVTAACGREGLVALEKDQPDLILLDVQMPGMSGFEVLTKIRELRCEAPVIMVTAYGSEDVAAEALRLGADDYIAKPLRVRNLCFRIQRNLEKARLRASQESLNEQLRQTTLELTSRLQDVIEANTSFRSLLDRILGDVRQLLERGGSAAEAIELLSQLRRIAQAEYPSAAYQEIAEAFKKANPS